MSKVLSFVKCRKHCSALTNESKMGGDGIEGPSEYITVISRQSYELTSVVDTHVVVIVEQKLNFNFQTFCSRHLQTSEMTTWIEAQNILFSFLTYFL